MRRVLVCAVRSVFILNLFTFAAFAQSDAEVALQQARTALENGEFSKARDFAKQAAQTDAKNPDVFLLLGKAHYQLGEVDPAITAWRKTLQLAPAHAYARQMIESLQDQITDTDMRIRLCEALVREHLWTAAQNEIGRLRREAGLSGDQRVRILQLETIAALDNGQTEQASTLLQEIPIRMPEIAATAGFRLLAARAKVASGGASVGTGLTELKAIVAEFADTPEAAEAELELIGRRLAEREVVEELAKWIEDHDDHPAISSARRKMQDAVTTLLSQPITDDITPDSKLTADEQAALAAAKHVYGWLMEAADEQPLTSQFSKHLESRYLAKKSFAAPTEAVNQLLAMDLSTGSRFAIESIDRNIKQAAASAIYAAIAKRLNNDPRDFPELKQWIADHPEHPQVTPAREVLLRSLLAMSSLGRTPDKDAKLTAADREAIEFVAEIAKTQDHETFSDKAVKQIIEHLVSRYRSNGAFAAAETGLSELRNIGELSHTSRQLTLMELANVHIAIATTRLTADAQAGRIQPGPLPADLNNALQTIATLQKEFPAKPTAAMRASLATEVAALSNSVPWPEDYATLKPTQAWAVEIAVPLIAENRSTETVKQASAIVRSVVDQCVAVQRQEAAMLAVGTHAKMMAAYAKEHANWSSVVNFQIELLMALSQFEFQANVAGGHPRQNAQLTESQKQMLTLASLLVKQRPTEAAGVLQKLEPYLSTWSQNGHDAVVEQSYELLQEDLPIDQQRQVQFALLRLWTEQALAADKKLLARGFKPAAELDEQLAIVLQRCYKMDASLPDDHALRGQLRALRDSIIDHYRQLEYFDVAIEAIKVKAEPAKAELDMRAELELAGLQLFRADRQLARELQLHQGLENIALTPAYRETIGAYQNFIKAHADHILARKAVQQWFQIGKTFESHQAHRIAATVYQDIEKFVKTIDQLSVHEPGTASIAERAAEATAAALHTQATDAMSEAGRDEPPANISDDFLAAIAAYQALIKNYPDGILVHAAIGRIMEIAVQYARVDAWDVADGIYAGLQQQELPLRRPERLELARALCQLGKVMPDHARQVLTAITLWERTAPAGQSAVGMVAGGVLGIGGSGFGGGGGFAADPFGDLAAGPATSMTAPGAPAEPQSGQQPQSANAPVDPADVAKTDDLFEMEAEESLDVDRANREADLLAAVRQQQSALASRIAMMRDETITHVTRQPMQQAANQQGAQQAEQVRAPEPVLSEAELQRQQKALNTAYAAFQAIRKQYPHSDAATTAREQILVAVNHWRSIRQWDRAADLAKRFLADNPRDAQLPSIRHDVANDYLAWAASGVEKSTPKQDLLEEIGKRFTMARDELSGIIAAFPENQEMKHKAQWSVANSFLSQARVVAAYSPTLARGQFVRAANELLDTADQYHDHPQIGQVPQMLWNIADELARRGFHDEAITVWNEMTLHYPGNALAEQAAVRIAQTYQTSLSQPLRAVESYLELNFARGGNDEGLQNTILQIATGLKNESRWVESLHVLETFVDSFPKHAQAGQALAMIGQIHQTNEVWEDAIAAYDRVIEEYGQGQWTHEAKWSIAECTINLSRWDDAIEAYREYQRAYPKDEKLAEANRRIEVLKDLARYQKVVDEQGQRKAFDAQYQIGSIVRSQLANPVKAVIEYRKVASTWPESHLADDALYEVGRIFMERNETAKAREALLAVAQKYPSSPLADDALYQVGSSYEREAQQLAGVTRGASIVRANDLAQKEAYAISQLNRRVQRQKTSAQISQLKKAGKLEEADNQSAFLAAQNTAFDAANAAVVSNWAEQHAEELTATQLADRQDKINAALRQAVASYRKAANVASADKADDALLQMAQIYDERLKDDKAAMATWLEIVKQYSGTTVAEDASWKIAQFYQMNDEHSEAIDAYQSFLRNYRRSPRAAAAQAAIAENYEQLGKWVDAMDAYTNYINNYPQGPLAGKAKEQISWIKTYRL